MTKLTDIETLGVALVARGANRKKFGVKKADAGEGDDDMPTTVAQQIAEVVTKGELPVDDAAFAEKCKAVGLTDPQAIETAKALVKLGTAFKDMGAFSKFVTDVLPEVLGLKAGAAPGQDDKQAAPPPKPGEQNGPPKDTPSGGAKPPPETQQTQQQPGQDPEKKKEPPMSTQKDDKTQAGADKGAGDGGTTTVSKTADQLKIDELQSLMKTQQDSFKASLESIQKSQQEERDARLKADWIRKAKDDLKFVPGKSADELGMMLFSLEKGISKEAADGQFAVMRSASVALEKSALFTPTGTRTPGPTAGGTDALSQLAKSADVILEKSNVMKEAEQMRGYAGMTSLAKAELVKALASQKALELNPELYAQFLREHKDQSGNRYQN